METLRIGFPVKVLGEPDLKSNDARRWQKNPHLRVSLEHLARIFDYLERRDLRMYRMSSDLAPYATHPDLPQFHDMVRACSRELRGTGERARRLDLRLSFHPSQYIVLNSPDETLVSKSVWDVATQAEILDGMELGPEAVLVIHVGGAYGDRQSGCERWVRTWERLPAHARARLVLENDYQHWWCFNPEAVPMREALQRMLATWKGSARPKIHFSSTRTELREISRKNRKTGKPETVLQPPLCTQHGDYANAFEFCTFLREHRDLDFDVMLESKAKDLAVLRLRRDMLRFAPDVAARFGIHAVDADDTADANEGDDPNARASAPPRAASPPR
jgi:UV DNA damage endonuclease